MNILVVGNGFDLAHGLPTRYSDFLDYLTLYIMKYEVSRRRHLYNTWGKPASYWQDYTPTLEKIYDNITKNSKVENLFNETSEQFKAMIEENSLDKFYENTFVRYCLYVYSYKQINARNTDGGYHGIFIDGIVSFNYTDTARIHFINGSLDNKKIILGVEKSDEYYDRETARVKKKIFG